MDEAISSQLGDHEISSDQLKQLQESAKQVIEQLEQLEDMDIVGDYIPDEFHVSSEEYSSAIIDPIQRDITLTKIDGALTHLAVSTAEAQ